MLQRKGAMGAALNMQQFRNLLVVIHPEGVTEEDVDGGEVALHSRAGAITWPAFESWHAPYFEEKRRNVEADKARL